MHLSYNGYYSTLPKSETRLDPAYAALVAEVSRGMEQAMGPR